MPTQQRVGLDEVELVPPAASATGEHDEEEPVCSPESRALHTSPQDDELLAKRSVLGEEFAAASRGVAGDSDAQIVAQHVRCLASRRRSARPFASVRMRR